MSDNTPITPGTGAKVASDEVTYSGDVAAVQLVRLVEVSGAEGSKTVGASAAATAANQATANTALATIAAAAADTTTPSPVREAGDDEYETVAASQTDQVMGATGAIGDRLSHVIIIPATTAAGAVSIKDGSGSAITIFAGGGTTALTNLIPFVVPLGLKATGAGWKVTTGANVSAIGVGDFT